MMHSRIIHVCMYTILGGDSWMGYCNVFLVFWDAELGRVGSGWDGLGIGLGRVVACMYVCGFNLVRAPHTHVRERGYIFFFLY